MNVDRVILAELKRFFKKTEQAKWSKKQIRDKIDEIAEQVIFTHKSMREDLGPPEGGPGDPDPRIYF